LYIDDFVGKGLSAGIILEFIMYQSAAFSAVGPTARRFAFFAHDLW
jgi:hypothetical protein